MDFKKLVETLPDDLVRDELGVMLADTVAHAKAEYFCNMGRDELHFAARPVTIALFETGHKNDLRFIDLPTVAGISVAGAFLRYAEDDIRKQLAGFETIEEKRIFARQIAAEIAGKAFNAVSTMLAFSIDIMIDGGSPWIEGGNA